MNDVEQMKLSYIANWCVTMQKVALLKENILLLDLAKIAIRFHL